ncbi:MAG: GNAT family N-acetyltransferase [Rothia aeria]
MLCRLWETSPGAWTFGRVAVHPDARGTGLGRKLLHAALEWIRDNTDAKEIVIAAQAYLKDTYYSPEGFVERGEHYMESGIEHVEMVLKL